MWGTKVLLKSSDRIEYTIQLLLIFINIIKLAFKYLDSGYFLLC